jgi:hypothetical protein
MAWLRRVWRAIVRAVRWVLRNTRSRLSPRGQLVFDWMTGLSLIAVGVIGLFVPILQGILFILAGLAVLSKHSALAHRLFERVKQAGRKAKGRLRQKSDKSN